MLARRNILPTHIQANAAGPGGLAQPTVAVVQRDGNAFAFAERRGNGVSQPTAILLGGLDAVHKNQNVFAGADSLLGVGVVQPYRLAVDLCAHKTGGPELRSDLNVRTVSGRRQ